VYLFVIAALNILKNILNSAGNDTTLLIQHIIPKSFHRKSLASTRLPVGHNCSIVTLQRRADREPSRLCIDLFLTGLVVIDAVKSKARNAVIVRILHVMLKVFRTQSLIIMILK
jgi:hypothetical protein